MSNSVSDHLSVTRPANSKLLAPMPPVGCSFGRRAPLMCPFLGPLGLRIDPDLINVAKPQHSLDFAAFDLGFALRPHTPILSFGRGEIACRAACAKQRHFLACNPVLNRLGLVSPGG
jgi:hypothetical protein